MIKKYTIDGNYWEIIDKVVAEYKATDEYRKNKASNDSEPVSYTHLTLPTT